MMLKPTKILTKRQLIFLDLFNVSPFISTFYLTGGTALCGFYLPYRYSEDLDFFSEIEFETQTILAWLTSVRKQLNYVSFDIQTSFNRNLIFLEYADETLKTEFTFFPFQSYERQKYKKIAVDSIYDIALNKLFTIYQNPRLRDYMDLYVIMKRDSFLLSQIKKDARIKFDWHIDPIQLGSQLLKVTTMHDAPKLIERFNRTEMEIFFKDLVVQLRKDILE